MNNENFRESNETGNIDSTISTNYDYRSTDSVLNNNNIIRKGSSRSSVSSFPDKGSFMESVLIPESEMLLKESSIKSLLPGFEDNVDYAEESFIECSESECSVLDQQEYDYQRGSGWPSGILIMANVCLGMGILNYPRIFYEAGGVLPTFIALAIFVTLIAGSVYIIAYCCRYYACVNYQDMVRVHCGWQFGVLCTVLLFLELSGSLIVKMVVLSDQLDRLYSIIASEPLTKHYYLMPIAAVIFFLPMCFIRDFSCFKYVSIGGVMAALYITFGVAVVGYFKGETLSPTSFMESREEPKDFNLLLPLLVYGFHGHVEVPLVFSGLKKQKLHNFMKAVYSYLFISTLCYAVTGLFAYWTFGRNTNVDFLLNYPADNWFANAAILIVSFKLFTSFPVLFFVIRTVFGGFYISVISILPYNKTRNFLENYSVARILQTFIIFFFIILFSVLIPNISNAISLIGSVSCHFCFTLPGLCFFCLYNKSDFSNRKHFLRKIGGIFYIILGMFCFGVNLTVAIQSLTKGKAAL